MISGCWSIWGVLRTACNEINENSYEKTFRESNYLKEKIEQRRSGATAGIQYHDKYLYKQDSSAGNGVRSALIDVESNPLRFISNKSSTSWNLCQFRTAINADKQLFCCSQIRVNFGFSLELLSNKPYAYVCRSF